LLEIRGLVRRYVAGGTTIAALAGIDLSVTGGSFTAVVGRSGSGKTTLLRLIAGLEKPDAGSIAWNGEVAPPVGVVFQEPRLMPWLTVEQNIAFGTPPPPPATVRALLRAVGLDRFASALPRELSGGMAQRVAVARALARGAKLILMDEPFGALDVFTRHQMHADLLRLWRNAQPAILFVTHDIEEAALLAERIVVLEQGRVRAVLAVPARHPRDPLQAEVLEVRRAVGAEIVADRPTRAVPCGTAVPHETEEGVVA
jgi:sulfonate transport system ATP-binding protein